VEDARLPRTFLFVYGAPLGVTPGAAGGGAADARRPAQADRLRAGERGGGLIITHYESFSTTIQPPYSSTKG
jgi:hypothetical protein